MAVPVAMTYLPVAVTWRRLAEPPPDPLREADLALIWEGRRFPEGALALADGSPVRVLYPGRRAGGPGPDFRDAVVAFRGRDRLGDVELHVRASAFIQHGHQRDPAYDRLVLHAVYLDDTAGETPLASGARVPVAALAPWLERRKAEVAAWLQAPALWREPCASAPERLGEAGVGAVLEEAGRSRLRDRAAAIAADADRRGADEALWTALLEALGYGGDRDGFRRLASALPWRRLRRLTAGLGRAAARERAAAVLVAVAGLGPPPDATAGLPDPLRPALRSAGVRPLNRPERRLAAAAELHVRAGAGLARFAAAGVRSAASAGDLVADWTVVGPQGPALVGAERARELLLNAVLPFVSGLPGLRERALALAAELPAAAAYGKTAFLERNLAAGGRTAARTALRRQGLLSLHAQWCSRGGCGRCPLSPAPDRGPATSG